MPNIIETAASAEETPSQASGRSHNGEALVNELCALMGQSPAAEKVLAKVADGLTSILDADSVFVVAFDAARGSSARLRAQAHRAAARTLTLDAVGQVYPPDQVCSLNENELHALGLIPRPGLQVLQGSEDGEHGVWVEVRDGDNLLGVIASTAVGQPLEGMRPFLLAIAGIVSRTFRLERAERPDQMFRSGYEWTAERVNDLLIVVDAEWRVLYANPRAEEVIGIEAEAMRSRRITEVLRRRSGEDTRSLLAKISASGNAAKQEFKSACDESFWLEIRASSIEYGRGENAVVITAVDFTETRELQRQFLQAQRMEVVGRLAGGIAHDFNNVLTAINGYSELLLGEIETPSERGSVEEIRSASRRASSLTEKLHSISRRRQEPSKPACLNEVLTELRSLVSRLVESNVRFVSLFADDVPMISVDRTQVEQVVLNLVVNARDAMPNGGRIRFATRRRVVSTGEVEGLSAGVYGEVEVTDTGTGIQPEVMDRLFEPFFTTKESSLGTGLGLSTVYGIAKQADGHVEVQSVVGKGSSFRVLFPEATPEELDGSLQPKVSTSTAFSGPALGRGETVLVVEDDQALRRFFLATLERLGYRALSAPDGLAALTVVEDPASNVDLVLSDIVMPRMGGRELAEEMAGRHGEIGIVLMTGYVRAEDRLAELRIKHRVLQKPFETQELQEAVAEGLLRRKVPA